MEFVKEKALKVGAVQSYMIDAKEEFANEYALIALQAHAFTKENIRSSLRCPVR
ncbi:Argininosuccinate synthase [Anoxybacillus sp. BCO1]|nr:Argininosuccinate synthase [Anoxybacillus sp. BCO1]